MPKSLYLILGLFVVSLLLSSAFSYQQSPANCPNDVDCDGLSDTLEQWVADTFAPYYMFDEHDIVSSEQRNFLFQVTPVDLTSGFYNNYRAIALVVVALYPLDGFGGQFLGSRLFMPMHFGDTERLVIFLPYVEHPDPVLHPVMVWMNQHNHMRVYYTDVGQDPTYGTEQFQANCQLEWHEGWHVKVHVSEGKHAAFPCRAECEKGSRAVKRAGLKVFEWGETCNCNSPASRTLAPLLPQHNVGEPSMHQGETVQDIAELSIHFLQTEYIWEDIPFCGGFMVADRAGHGPVTSLTEQVLSIGPDRLYLSGLVAAAYNWVRMHFYGDEPQPICGGTIGRKWLDGKAISG